MLPALALFPTNVQLLILGLPEAPPPHKAPPCEGERPALFFSKIEFDKTTLL